MRDWNEWAQLALEINRDLRHQRPDAAPIDVIGEAMNRAGDLLADLLALASAWDAEALRQRQEVGR